jgi:prepilin-type N-terminal cleavage/methylation domain-containing protein
MSRPSSLKGFTLIELLIVIVIIGILSAGAVALFNGAQAKARNAKKQSDLKTMETALQLFAADHDSDVPVLSTKKLNDAYDTTAAATVLDQGLVGKYLQKAVDGPRASDKYAYVWGGASNPSNYALVTWLEDGTVYSVGNAITSTEFATKDTCPATVTGFAGCKLVQ